jgi:hypothetical protein
MAITTHHTTTVLRRSGVLIVTGVAAALVGLGMSGTATASPFDPTSPFVSDDALDSKTVDHAQRDSEDPLPPPLLWDPTVPSGPDLGDSVTLNRQPLPPGPDRGDSVTLNPQPLPPGPDRGVRIGLNPQPLPPGPDLWRGILTLPGF